MTPEQSLGISALKNFPFSAVTIDQHLAFDDLTWNTQRVALENYWNIKMGNTPRNTENPLHMAVMDRANDYVGANVYKGGQFILTHQKIDELYGGRETFQSVIKEPFYALSDLYYSDTRQLLPKRIDGRSFIGHAFDCTNLLGRQFRFNLGLQLISECLEGAFKPKEVGTLLDSALHGNTVPGILQDERRPTLVPISTFEQLEKDTDDDIDPWELRIDTENIKLLRDMYLETLDINKKREFHLGERHSVNYRIIAAQGASAN